jgi:glycosyltransferase involved in cell wall biosynthesis
MLRLGITGDAFIRWGGGLDFLRTVVSSLHATAVPMELHFLAPGQGPRAAFQRVDRKLRTAVKAVLGKKNALSYEPSRVDLHRAIGSFGVPIETHDIDIGPRALARQARHLSLDVLLPSFSPLPFGKELPWLGYLYDFQHRHLPEFFTEKERAQRDRQFEAMLARASVIIVNAKAVETDIATFYPGSHASVFALPFSTAPSENWLAADPSPIREKYGVSLRYLILCNQFWLHKDHATAFTAFADLARRPEYADVDLVCTGATSDHRSVGHFEALMQQLREKGLESRVHILGLIPKSDQIALLKGAVALLQPTLSEGGPGGGAVYDAVALGVPSIVSDITVNFEIADEELVSFFHARDPVSLTQAMRTRLAAPPYRSTPVKLIEQGRARRMRCGNVLLSAIDCARRGQ